MAIIKCPECGHQVSDHANTCPNCGVGIAGKVMRCPDCGEIVFNDQEMCPNCHSPLHSSQPKVMPTTKPTPTSTADIEKERVGETIATKEEKPKKKGAYTAGILGFVVALIIVFVVGYFHYTTEKQNEIEAYENALASSEPSVLQNYLDIYTDAPIAHRDSIEAHLEALKAVDTEWTNAVVSNSKTALERYIKLHPGSVHIPEAKIKIDSIDWVAATTANTPEAYQAYINAHSDGLHYDEARTAYDKADASQVSDEDRQMVSDVCSRFFRALALKDEDGLTAAVGNVMTDFLHKSSATKSDVIAYMHKLHSPTDISGMTFRSNNDWKIDKKEVTEGEYEYKVSFSVDQKIERSDDTKETFATYKVDAKISPEGKIVSLNMKKIVQ